jgi:hypothetical protein
MKSNLCALQVRCSRVGHAPVTKFGSRRATSNLQVAQARASSRCDGGGSGGAEKLFVYGKCALNSSFYNNGNRLKSLGSSRSEVTSTLGFTHVLVFIAHLFLAQVLLVQPVDQCHVIGSGSRRAQFGSRVVCCTTKDLKQQRCLEWFGGFSSFCARILQEFIWDLNVLY